MLPKRCESWIKFFINNGTQETPIPPQNSAEILLQLITPLSEAFVEHETEVSDIPVTEKVRHRISEETFFLPGIFFFGFFCYRSLPTECPLDEAAVAANKTK